MSCGVREPGNMQGKAHGVAGQEEEQVGRLRGRMDGLWSSLTRAWWKPGASKTSEPPQRTYCAKYDRLAAGDEVFCDQLDYCLGQEEEEEENNPDTFPILGTPEPLSPDSGHCSSSAQSLGLTGPGRICKSLSLQFPRLATARLPFSRSTNFCPSDVTSSASAATTPALSLEEEDYDWDEEELTCNVCDRSFETPRQLERHQQRKRHWGCDACDNLFNSLGELEHHKEEMEHWSDDEFESGDEDEDDEEDDDGEECDCGCSGPGPFLASVAVGTEGRWAAGEEETQFGAEGPPSALLAV